MGQGLTIVLTVIATAVVVVILRLARRLNSLPWAIALGLLLGGAFGNLTDRIFRSPSVFEGHVVDFIAPKHFAIFNLADSAIVIGGCLIVLLSFLGLQPDGTRDGEDAEDDEATSEAPDATDEPAAATDPATDRVADEPTDRAAGRTGATAAKTGAKPAAQTPAEPVERAAEPAPEQVGEDRVVESGPEAGHTRIS